MSTKKCPNCGVESPPNAIVCQCGYNLATGKASLRESLAEQAQGFKKAVRKIRPGADVRTTKKCPFCAEQILAEAIFCKHCGKDLRSPEGVQTKDLANPRKGKPAQVSGCLILLVGGMGWCATAASTDPSSSDTAGFVYLLFLLMILAGIGIWIYGSVVHWWHWK